MGEFDKLKRRDRRKELELLIRKGLESSLEDRNDDVVRDKVRLVDRINNSLLLSNDKDSNPLCHKIKECRKHNRQSKKVKEDFQYRELGIDPFSNPNYVKKNFQSKNSCQSLWCPHCRKVVSKVYEYKVREHIKIRHNDVPYSNGDLLHISGVLGLCSVDYKELKRMIDRDSNNWINFRYHLNKLPPSTDPFIESVYEFELVNWEFLRSSDKSPQKKKQIKQLIEHQRFTDRVFLYVHFHSVTNLSREQIDTVFGDRYLLDGKSLIGHNKSNGLYIQSLHSEKPLETNIEKICSYPFKNPHRFKHSFLGSEYQNGEMFSNEELSSLILIYQKIQSRSWRTLFRSVTHKLSKEMLKTKELFPNEHTVWSNWFRFQSKDEPYGENHPFRKYKPPQLIYKKDGDRWTLPMVMVVDSFGVCYLNGWSPNNFYPKGIEIRIINRKREIIGKEYFLHPYYPMIEIYKNKYGEDKFSGEQRIVGFEEIFYPKQYLKLKRDQFLDVGKYGLVRYTSELKGVSVFDKKYFDSHNLLHNPIDIFRDPIHYEDGDPYKEFYERVERFRLKRLKRDQSN